MSKITKRLKEEVVELNEYVIRNERNIKKLKELYERAVNINKCFTDRIKTIKKEYLIWKEECTPYVKCMKHALHFLMMKNLL